MFWVIRLSDRAARAALARAVIEFAANRTANRTAAAAVTLVVVLWRLALVLRDAPKAGFTSTPDMLAFMLTMVVLIPAVLVILFSFYLFFGGVGWLVAQLTQLVIRWRAEGELREGMTKIQIASVITGVIFLGVPELFHATTWWHEHALRFVPGEEAVLDGMVKYYEAHADTIHGMMFFSALAFWPFRGVAKNFRLYLRESIQIMKDFVVQRGWRFPSTLVVVIAVTATLLFQYEKGSFNPVYDSLLGVLLELQVIALVLWVFLPIIIPNLAWIILGAALLVPSFMLDNRLGHGAYFGVAIVWGAWLTSITWWPRMWRSIYWVGVLGFLGYLAV